MLVIFFKYNRNFRKVEHFTWFISQLPHCQPFHIYDSALLSDSFTQVSAVDCHLAKKLFSHIQNVTLVIFSSG